MAKFTDFKTPTGQSGNLLSVSSWLQLIVGTFVLLMSFSLGQMFFQKARGYVPVNTTIEPIIDTPAGTQFVDVGR